MSIQGSGGNPTFPAQWLYGLWRALPGRAGLVVTVAREKRELLHELDASIRGVRTTRFYRTLSCRSLIGTTGVHRIPAPRFVAIMTRPSDRDGMAVI